MAELIESASEDTVWPVKNKIPASIGEYNESMNCQVKDELVSQLIVLNNNLNLLSPDLVYGAEERAGVQQQRENLYAESKHHRATGHEGKPSPAARQDYPNPLDSLDSPHS